MKRSVFLIVLLFGSVCATIRPLIAGSATPTPATNMPAGPPMSRMDQEKAAWQERVRRLQKLGEIPETTGPLNNFDWQAAQETSWWGKPLDPQAFWKDRVVWLDDSAAGTAARHGRAYPPMPYNDPTLSRHKTDVDIEEMSGGVEELRLMVHYTSKEAAFWDKFSKTHPKPPEVLERKQVSVADEVQRQQHRIEHHDFPAQLRPEILKQAQQIDKQEALELGYPPEAFTDDALFWSYVLKKRHEYQTLINGARATNDAGVENFMSRLAVDAKYLTQPSDAEVLKLANAWKIAYLQRLSKEKVDQSYINAYLKAWSLKSEEVFANVANAPQPTR